MKVDYDSTKEFFVTEFNFYNDDMRYLLFVGFVKSIFDNEIYSDTQKAKIVSELLAAFEETKKK